MDDRTVLTVNLRASSSIGMKPCFIIGDLWFDELDACIPAFAAPSADGRWESRKVSVEVYRNTLLRTHVLVDRGDIHFVDGNMADYYYHGLSKRIPRKEREIGGGRISHPVIKAKWFKTWDQVVFDCDPVAFKELMISWWNQQKRLPPIMVFEGTHLRPGGPTVQGAGRIAA